jgi:hypothetical protein
MVSDKGVEIAGVLFSYGYLVASAAGAGLILLFCFERFDQPARTAQRFVESLVPLHLTSPADYLKAFLIYYLSMVGIYAVLCFLGPQALIAFRPETVSGYTGPVPSDGPGLSTLEHGQLGTAPVWFPLALVIMLSGLSTHYPIFNQIELLVRRLTHRFIGIPEGVERLASILERAPIDVYRLEDHEKRFVEKRYKEATGEQLDNIEMFHDNVADFYAVREWVRLLFFYNLIENRAKDLPESFDWRVFDFYRPAWDKIKARVFDLTRERVLALLAPEVQNPENPPERDTTREFRAKIEVEIKDTLRDMHALIAACIAKSCRREESISEVLQALRLAARPSPPPLFANVFLAGVFMLFVSVFLIVFLTPSASEWLGYKQPERPFPQTSQDALKWATAAIFLHGAAAFAAWRYRASVSAWVPMCIRDLRIPSLQYTLIAAWGFVGGTVGLFVWWYVNEIIVTSEFPQITAKLIWIPAYGFLGACTGFWTSYTIDVATRTERRSSPLRLTLQPILQGASTGLLGGIITNIVFYGQSTVEYELYIGFVTAFEGVVIGLIVLLFARQRPFYDRATKYHGKFAPGQ